MPNSEYDGKPITNLKSNSGDIVVFDCRLLHKGNIDSRGDRRAIYFRMGMGDNLNEAFLRASDYLRPGDQAKQAEMLEADRFFGPEVAGIIGKSIDYKNELAVSFKGSVPNLFQEGKGVVAEGFLKDRSYLKAVKILAKHDENYMPPEVSEALEKAKK